VNRSVALYWQEKCLNYTLPPDRVAYVAAPKGLELPSYLADFSQPAAGLWSGTVAAAPYPIELAEFHKQTDAAVVAWETLPAPVFLHGLTDSSGRQKLVTVFALANNPLNFWTLMAVAADPANPQAPRTPTQKIITTASWPLSNGQADTLVVFAGQPDPKDRSRFSLRVRLNGTDQQVSGQLLADGRVVFTSSTGLTPWDTSRTGPLLVPAPPAQDLDHLLLPTD
jgi:hypothetical protein